MEMMKDGTIRGTPQEIMEYQRLQAEQAERKPLKSPSIADDGSILGIPKITSGSTTAVAPGKCPNEGHACLCTGACQRTFTVRNNGYFDYPAFVRAKV